MDNITVKYGKLKKIIEALETMELTDDSDVSFEYVVGSCFPEIYQNIKKEIHIQYTKGYMDGIKEEQERKEEE